MEGFKDENYSWYKAAGLVFAVYIMLVFAEIMTGKGTSVFWFSAALGRLLVGVVLAGVLTLILNAFKFKFTKIAFAVLTTVFSLMSLIVDKNYKVHEAFKLEKPQANQVEPITPEVQAKVDIPSELTELSKVHPDFAQIASDPVFIEWVNKQPANIKALYASTSAKDNIKLLDEYKKAKVHQAKVRSDYINKIISEKPKQLFEILPVSDNEPNPHLFSGNGLNETLVTYKSAGDLINVSEKDSKYFRSGIFIGYVIGVFDAASNTLFCAPQGFTIQQAIDVSVSYIENKPDRRHFSGSRLVLEALISKYPCKR